MGTANEIRPRGASRRWDAGWSEGRPAAAIVTFRAGPSAPCSARDGLLTNLSLVLGVAGASTNASAVRLAGVAGLLAGAFSMAAGELVSVRAQQEMVVREIGVERQELADDPEGEQRELAGIYRASGLSEPDASTVARILSTNPAGSSAVIASVIIGAIAAAVTLRGRVPARGFHHLKHPASVTPGTGETAVMQ